MSDHAENAGNETHGGHETHHGDYVRVWKVLLVLLVVSVVGPIVASAIEHRPTALAVTLSTAFGIAVVKAYMVVKNFMHIQFTQRFVPYLVVTMLVFMFLLFAGAAPDVMKSEGRNWVKPGWIAENADYRAHHPDGSAGGAH
ncbi:cytochrome c oxidase subunit IV [Myxococcaceae bacterium]|nr:cytochrome c oxidase subunit IV [Myxococcaceae bacterium]